jgi:hypothetical protein
MMRCKCRYIKKCKEEQREKSSTKRDNTHPTPLANVQKWTNQGFCEDICKMSGGINMVKINVPFLIMISEKMKAEIDVIGLGMQHEILGNTYGTRAITK